MAHDPVFWVLNPHLLTLQEITVANNFTLAKTWLIGIGLIRLEMFSSKKLCISVLTTGFGHATIKAHRVISFQILKDQMRLKIKHL